MAAYIGSEHYEVSFTPEEGFAAVKATIEALESFDVTTIRASTRNFLFNLSSSFNIWSFSDVLTLEVYQY